MQPSLKGVRDEMGATMAEVEKVLHVRKKNNAGLPTKRERCGAAKLGTNQRNILRYAFGVMPKVSRKTLVKWL